MRPPALRLEDQLEAGCLQLEGFHAVKHALRFGADVREAVTPDLPAVLALAQQLAPDLPAALAELVTEVPAADFDDLVRRRVGAHGVRSPLLAAVAPPVAGELPLGHGPVVVLDAPTHAGNVGACIRVAAAAGAAGVAVTGNLDPWSAAALRASAGLHFALPVVATDPASLLAAVAGRPDVPLVALDPTGDPLSRRQVEGCPVLAFGSERRGLSEALLAAADARARLPMREGVSSLNLATAVAAVLYAGRLG